MRMRIVTILLFPCCIAIASPLRAQVGDSIHLALRSFLPRPGIDSATGETVRTARGRVHVLVQLTRGFTDRERSEIGDQLRFRVTQTLSPTLYIGSVSGGPLPRTLPVPVRWIGLISPKDKVGVSASHPGPALLTPRAGGESFVALFHPDVPRADQQAALQRHGATRIGRLEQINGWVFAMPRDSVAGLSEEDIVHWIESGPNFGAADNDIARSATGINADAVLAPSLYGLSGAGMTLSYWDASIPFDHVDFGGRMTNADGLPIPWFMRTLTHTDDVLANGKLDPGESLYIDVDDSRAVTPSVDLKAGTTSFDPVPATATASPLVPFNANERFVDRNHNGAYDPGEPIYDDSDVDNKVTAGETLLGGTGSIGDVGSLLLPVGDPHWHSTMVVGSMIGDGSNSETGTTGSLAPASGFQWKGIAPGARASARAVCKTTPCSADWLTGFNNELAATPALSMAGYVHPWGIGGCHVFVPPVQCYSAISQLIDAYSSDRDWDGSVVGVAKRTLAIASSGNDGYPERHTEIGPPDGRFSSGEAIYKDVDGNGVVDNAIDTLLTATAAADGATLVDFAADEKHVVDASDRGRFRDGRGIYRDVDGSGKVTVNDARLEVAGGLGPTVHFGDADVGQTLVPFVLWRNVQVYMAAKNSLQVGAVPSDGMTAPAFSSRGPTQDGRMKPDLVAAGTQLAGTLGVTSTYPRNGYATTYGTSMSTGVAAGAVALLTEWFRASCQSTTDPSPELVRALFAHSADDVVDPNLWAGVGPDYATGYGRMRVKDAVDLAQHHLVGSLASTTPPFTRTITIPRSKGLKVTMAWSDPAWDPLATAGSHGILNNDLDLLLIAPDGRKYGPWLLDPKHPELSATRSSYASGSTPVREVRNTIEQVVVDDAMPGAWTIQVTAGLMNYGPQSFAIVSEAIPPSMSPCAATPAGDVWVRDNDTDVGSTPSTGAMYLGPDLWNRTSADGVASHQNPEYGQPNYLYATIRNRGATKVVSTTVELWLGDASTGLVWPTSYTYVGRVVVPSLAPGEVRQVGAVSWTPPAPGHYCMYMRLLSAQDPMTSPEGASVLANARDNNNVAYRNLNIVDLHSAKAATFLLRNVDVDDRAVDLVIRVPMALLQTGSVDLALSPGLQRAWATRDRPVSGLSPSRRLGLIVPGERSPSPTYSVTGPEVVLSGFRLRGRQAERVTLTFASARRDTATFNVDVEQHVGTQVVGGIRYVIRTGRP